MKRWTRRGVLGVGAGALGAGLAAPGGAGADVGAPAPFGSLPQGLAGSPQQVTFPPPPAGTVRKVFGAMSYTAQKIASADDVVNVSGSNVACSPGPGFVALPIDVPAGSRIRRIDALGVVGSAVVQPVALFGGSLLPEPTLTNVATGSLVPSVSSLYVGVSLTTDVTVGPDDAWMLVHQGTQYSTPVVVEQLNMASGAIVHYEPPARSFVPVAPFRVFDSRWTGFGGRFAGGTSRVVSVADARTSTGAIAQANAVPAGAVAITFNVTVSGMQGGAGLLSVTPASSTSFTTSTINWNGSGVSLANGSTVSLSGNRQVRIHCAGNTSTNAILDVTGFYL